VADQPLRDIYLQPGELHLVSEPALMRTILGSCVGITFRHAGLGLGGMCHPMLPSDTNLAGSARCAEPRTRFVDFAIREMARGLDAFGAPRHEVEVKLFGGSDVLPVNHASRRATVGQLNSESALRILEEEGFQVAASSLGGKCGVNIRFDTSTGEVLLRRLG
jgi:chemotaxis protein CheD